MTRIVLAGCGGIGWRHLEGLDRLSAPTEVFVVEPDAGRRQLVEGMVAAGFSAPDRVRCLDDFDGLPPDAEVAIVATTAAARRNAVERLLQSCRPASLVLEKVLFQRLADYDAVGRLLAERGVRAWVNCPRRLWPQYRALAAEIAPCPELLLRVTGPPTIGLGSNAIHMLDLFAFLIGDATIVVDAGQLHLHPDGGKRGAIEFVGTLACHTATGGTLLCSTLREGNTPLRLEVDCRDLIVNFEESRGMARRATAASGWQWCEFAAPPVYQSRLTDLLVQDLLATGDCGLATFAESSRLHLALLSALDNRLQALGLDLREGIPIT